MRTAAFAILVVPLAFACKKAPPASSPSPQLEAPATANLTGKVLETIDASQYTYLRLQTAKGEVWAAVPVTRQAEGTEVTVAGPMWMENFRSNSLNRTWSRIAFGTLHGDASPSRPASAAVKDPDAIKVAKASSPQARTVADIWTQRTQLQDKRVAVRGKVVKATNGVMGKNWLHLRDGTGEGATSDITVATEQTAGVGDTVLVSGTVHLDRDLGAGYHYDVIVEDAQLQAE
jgi:hypothetical protein